MTVQDGVSREGLTFDQIANLKLLLPPIEDQQLITRKITEEYMQINALVAKVERAVELLKEYRIALISAAVTGKIDLREESA